jgi:hypothetical protein
MTDLNILVGDRSELHEVRVLDADGTPPRIPIYTHPAYHADRCSWLDQWTTWPGDAAQRLDDALFSTWDRVVDDVRRLDLALGDAWDRAAAFERMLWRRREPLALRIAVIATIGVGLIALAFVQTLHFIGQGR